MTPTAVGFADGVMPETEEIMKSGVSTAATPDRVDKDTTTRTKGTGATKRKVTETDYNAVFTYTVEGKSYTITSKDFSTESAAKSYMDKTDTVRYLAKDPNKARLVD